MINDLEDLLNDDENNNEVVSLDLEKIESNLSKYSSQKLCEMIAADRYLKMNEKISIMCMTELSNRRINGENFDFELQIEECLKELPPLDFGKLDLRTILNQAIGKKI